MSAPGVDPVVSVVVPALNAEATLADCLRALETQSMPAVEWELIVVVDERSIDRTADVARSSGAKVVAHSDAGAGPARNRGIAAARGKWVAFTDADCIPARGWLKSLVDAAEEASGDGASALGAAGQTIGFESTTPAARFVDLSGGLRADRNLSHQRYPWAPSANTLYRRAALLVIGGFDERFVSYEGCDLHTRLVRNDGGSFVYVPRAIVSHRHRASWRAYWQQQVNYGRGYAQFFLRYSTELRWSPADELRAWLSVMVAGLRAATVRSGDSATLRHGAFVKALAQRRGFLATYWRRNAARRWRTEPAVLIEPAT